MSAETVAVDASVRTGRVEALHPGRLVTATPRQRLLGMLLDSLASNLTLGIGWLIWLIVVAERGQSPGKQLLGTYVIRTDGQLAGRGRTILRQLAVAGAPALSLVIGMLAFITAPSALTFLLFAVCGAVGLLSNVWLLFDSGRQSFWDKLFDTLVGYAAGSDA